MYLLPCKSLVLIVFKLRMGSAHQAGFEHGALFIANSGQNRVYLVAIAWLIQREGGLPGSWLVFFCEASLYHRPYWYCSSFTSLKPQLSRAPRAKRPRLRRVSALSAQRALCSILPWSPYYLSVFTNNASIWKTTRQDHQDTIKQSLFILPAPVLQARAPPAT